MFDVILRQTIVMAARNVAMCAAIGLATSFAHAVVPDPVFHLDFSTDTIVDVSSNAMPITVGASVARVAGGGPTLPSGTIDSGMFPGPTSRADGGIQVTNPILDAIANNNAGSSVAWMKVNVLGWNTVFTQDIFLGTTGLELDFCKVGLQGQSDLENKCFLSFFEINSYGSQRGVIVLARIIAPQSSTNSSVFQCCRVEIPYYEPCSFRPRKIASS